MSLSSEIPSSLSLLRRSSRATLPLSSLSWPSTRRLTRFLAVSLPKYFIYDSYLTPCPHLPQEESLGSACFELASNIMMISRKSKVLLTSEGANAGGDVTIEARKSFLPTAAAAQAPVAPSLPSNLAPEEVEGVVGSFKENETGDLSRFLPPTATEVANHKVTTSGPPRATPLHFPHPFSVGLEGAWRRGPPGQVCYQDPRCHPSLRLQGRPFQCRLPRLNRDRQG